MLLHSFSSILLLFVLVECCISVPLVVGRGMDSEEAPPLDQDWACGADEFSMLIAEATIERDCPLHKNRFNNCCVTHDKCYEEQRGQQQCDNVFCTCVQLAAADNQQCQQEDAPAFCNLVREFGSEAYVNAGKIAKNTRLERRY